MKVFGLSVTTLISLFLVFLFLDHNRTAKLRIEYSIESDGLSQVFFNYHGGFEERYSKLNPIAKTEGSAVIEFEIPKGIDRTIRFDPVNLKTDVQIHSLFLKRSYSWSEIPISESSIGNVHNATIVGNESGGFLVESDNEDPMLFVNLPDYSGNKVEFYAVGLGLWMVLSLTFCFLVIVFLKVFRAKIPSFYGEISSEGRDLEDFLSRALRGKSAFIFAGLLLVSLFANGVGIHWGLPAYRPWAPDEILTSKVLEALDQKFSGGWSFRYPPGYFYAVGFLHGMARMIDDPTWLDWEYSRYLETYHYLTRGLTLLCGVGCTAVFYLMLRQLFSKQTSTLVTFLSIWIVPFSYFAKIGNLDVPYLFWFLAAYFFYVRYWLKGGNAFCHLAYTFFSVVAVATKDQSAALFFLPTLLIFGDAIRRHVSCAGHGWGSLWRSLECWTVALVFLLTFLVLFNLPFNWAGFQEHIALILGDASQDYRIYEGSLRGHLTMFGTSLVTALYSVGPISFVLFLASFFIRSKRKQLWFYVLPIVSYYLIFISVIGYNYLRFFLPISIVMLLLSGFVWEKLFRKHLGVRTWILILLAAVPGVYINSAISTSMILDNRYLIEQELDERFSKDQEIGIFFAVNQQIRKIAVKAKFELMTGSQMLHGDSSYDAYVVNLSHWRRGYSEEDLYQKMEEKGYAVEKHYPQKFDWVLPKFLPIHTNLTKISPEMILFYPKEQE
ncbi:MAG: hypothetical protein MI748_17660 [Opitutales bacterium]|nr:hypothetical protein [Opitutales bacterium]